MNSLCLCIYVLDLFVKDARWAQVHEYHCYSVCECEKLKMLADCFQLKIESGIQRIKSNYANPNCSSYDPGICGVGTWVSPVEEILTDNRCTVKRVLRPEF